MAISPTVNQYMGQEQQEGPQSVDQLFTQQFSSQAYNNLRAKYPQLVNYVVTFKMLYSEVEEGTAFGIFIVQNGKDLVYVPVTMSGGGITSCEMGYNKQSDQFFPLNEDTVKEIIDANNYTDPAVMDGNARVEDTRAMLHNMIRPPVSSHVIMAGERGGISALPNEYKAMVSTYLSETNPKLLGKIASFYDVQELAHKLALAPEEKVASEEEIPLPEFLSLDTLTKEAASCLSADECKDILEDGWLVRSNDSAFLVAPMDKLASAIEDELKLFQYSGSNDGHCHCHHSKGTEISNVFCADLISCDSKGITKEHVLVFGKDIANKKGYIKVDSENPVLLGQSDCCSCTPSDLIDAVPVTQLMSKLSGPTYWAHIDLFVPARNNSWMCIHGAIDANRTSIRVTSEGDCTEVRYGDGSSFICVDKNITKGYVYNKNALVVPEGSLFFVVPNVFDEDNNKHLPSLSSFEILRRTMVSLGTPITSVDDGVQIKITDKNTEKTASFNSRAQAAEWLHSTYGMDGKQVRTALSNPNTIVFSKTAFAMPPEAALPPEQQPLPAAPEEQGMAMEMPNNETMGQVQDPAMQQQQYDPSVLEDYAVMEDPELMDAGILSTFAQYPDIKGLLIDYLPDFISAQDRVGRILLLFSYKKKETEEVYGTEKYAAIVGACRKIFSILGNLVSSLKTYIHMA